ncbi:hypothetical protein HHK36_002651 [Tetracentron sinense]|uniref:MRG domain-containing protein n=1 Tax=Tetracentron sinense TaxID=13715 RepID=A0A834ZLV9_TETSI|nr:hypothetical protein HHK36_002651 [Tetracentron sinense]
MDTYRNGGPTTKKAYTGNKRKESEASGTAAATYGQVAYTQNVQPAPFRYQALVVNSGLSAVDVNPEFRPGFLNQLRGIKIEIIPFKGIDGSGSGCLIIIAPVHRMSRGIHMISTILTVERGGDPSGDTFFDNPDSDSGIDFGTNDVVAGLVLERAGRTPNSLLELDTGMMQEKDTMSVEKLMKIQIPSTLKKQLVDDWEFVTQLGKLVKLPRSPSVDDILKRYLDYKAKKDGMIAESIGEILKGLRCYFDKALPVMLLYKGERQQYHEAVVDNTSPSTIYGAEHLLRLFVKLPELLTYANIEEETLTRLQQKLIDFLKFLQKNQSAFFLSTYDGSRGFGGSCKEQDD